MEKNDKQQLVKLIKKSIKDTNKMFNNESKSRDYIIGYLQGTLKQIAIELNK